MLAPHVEIIILYHKIIHNKSRSETILMLSLDKANAALATLGAAIDAYLTEEAGNAANVAAEVAALDDQLAAAIAAQTAKIPAPAATAPAAAPAPAPATPAADTTAAPTDGTAGNTISG